MLNLFVTKKKYSFFMKKDMKNRDIVKNLLAY